MPSDIELGSRPISIADILAGVRYAAAFDGKGWSVGPKRHIRRCRRLMRSIVSSIGHRPRDDGAVTLDPVRRALQDRGRRAAEIVELHCSLCPHRRQGDCAGRAQP